MPQSTPNRTAIAETLSRLLAHFATADEPLAVRKAMAEDWLCDLAEFTSAQVQWAATKWRRTQSLRPTIAEIRTLATQAQHRDRTCALEDKTRAQQGPRWEPWLVELWGPASTGTVARVDAIAGTEARYLRAAVFRGRDMRQPVSITWGELWQTYHSRYSELAIERAWQLIAETNAERRRRAVEAEYQAAETSAEPSD